MVTQTKQETRDSKRSNKILKQQKYLFKFFNIFLRLGITRFLFGLCDHIIVSLRSFNITNISKK